MTDTPLTRLVAEDEETRRRKGTLHTPAEILQQPWLWRETAQRVAAVAQRSEALLKGAEFALLTGAGSSLHAARMIEDAARLRFGPAVVSVSCTDLMLAPEAYVPKGRKGVLFSLSRSGESPEAVEAARVVAERFPDVVHVAITCNAQGKLAKIVAAHSNGLCLALHEKAYDKGLGTTSSVTSTALAGRLILDLAVAPRVDTLAKECERVLASSLPEEIASRDPERVVVLGFGPLEAAAQEAAHKILELTDGQVATKAHSYLEFRHGAISFVNRRTTVIYFVARDPGIWLYQMDFLDQMSESRAAMETVAFMTGGNPEIAFATGVDHLWPALAAAQDLQTGESALLAVVFGQMVALFISLKRGLKPDRPGDRGLVNPIVKGVTIYPREEKP